MREQALALAMIDDPEILMFEAPIVTGVSRLRRALDATA